MDDTLSKLYAVVESRREEPMEGSYTCYLFAQGIDKILKKVGEEASEVIIAAKNDDREALTGEIGDLVYHLLVMMVDRGIFLEKLDRLLAERSEKIGNLKTFHKVDKES